MSNLCDMLNIVINDAMDIGFPISDNLERNIYIDKKTYDRVGACYRYRFPERYEIHLSEYTLKAKENEIKNIIAHEVLHANFLTMKHNTLWKMYCERMNGKFGYDIKITYSWHEIIK